MELPKTLKLTVEGQKPFHVEIRPYVQSDRENLMRFYADIPESESILFKENIHDEQVVVRRIEVCPNLNRIVILALKDEEIVGESNLEWRPNSRSAHVGEVRFYISPEYRNMGIGNAMLKEIYYMAQKKGIEKLTGSIPKAFIPQFQHLIDRLGFEKEAVLKDHIVNAWGKKEDLVVFSLKIMDLWDLISDWQSPYGRAMEY